MNKTIFKELLAKANLSQKELSIILKTSNQTINNWGSNGRDIPYWVESWLQNYIDKKKFENIKKTLKDSGVCDE